MPRKRIITIDADTGEELSGIPVWVGRPSAFTGLYGFRFFAVSQNALKQIATDRDLTLEPKNVLFYLMSCLDFDNYIHVSQVEIAKALSLHKSQVSRSIKLLIEKGIILPGPKAGRLSSYRMNPDYGYKGDPRGKIYRQADGRAVFRVISGGKESADNEDGQQA